MMSESLEAVAAGDVSAAIAQKAIAAALHTNDGGAPGRIYDALRAFVLVTLIERRGFGDELPAWKQLVRRTRSALLRQNAKEGEWMRPLSDLIGDAIGFTESYRLEDVVRLAHVREILCALRDASERSGSAAVARAEIKCRSGLADANLSRVLSTLIQNRLVERHKAGKYASYELTARGRSELRRLPAAPSERTRQPSLDLGEERAPKVMLRPTQARVATARPSERALDPPDFSLAVREPRREHFIASAPKAKRVTSTRACKTTRIRSRSARAAVARGTAAGMPVGVEA